MPICENHFALQKRNIGSKIAKYLNKKPENYSLSGVERPAYFMVIGPYYSLEGKGRTDRPGWEMNDNLMKALENLKLV